MITGRAKALGFDETRLAGVTRSIQSDIDAERYDGAVLCVTHHGEVVAQEAIGYAERSSRTEMKDDSVFFSMSIAKQFTVAVVLNRVERGDLSLTMKVADVIPEFAARGKGKVTLHQMLTHTAGLMFGVPPLDITQLGDLAAVVQATCNLPPDSAAGQQVQYSAIVAHAVMAEMVRRVEGSERSYRAILAEDLFEPLGMGDTALGKRKDLAERMCPVVARDTRRGMFEPEMLEALGAMLGPDWEIPAGGCLTTAADLTVFANMLRNGGEWNGARILSPAMIDLATRNHTGDEPNRMWSYTVEMRGWDPFPAVLGLGFFLRGEGIFPTPFGTLASPRTFGGLGAGSNLFWVDPERDLTLVFLSTGLLEESYNCDRLQRISDSVLAAAVR